MLDALYQSLDPVAFSIGPISVRWYGLGYIFGFLLAALLAYRIARRWKIRLSVDALLTVVIGCVIGTVLGGRLGYVLFYGNGYYFSHPAEILAFSQGGMSFHGGLIGFAIGLIIAARIIRFPILSMGDLAAICTPIALGLVRVANFINGELWGATTTLPWGVVFAGAGDLPRHPTQLYEALLEGLVLLIVLYMLARRKPPLPQGSYFGVFLIGYSIFRIAVEFVRQPDSHIGYLFGTDWVTMGMLLSFPMAIVGIGFLIFAARTKWPQSGLPPANPIKPADPADPANSANPTKPADPANPTNPTKPANPADPAKPAKP
jgi:phosphatidylglycerol:prolipoprotein diacylglycerol transferase